MDEQSESGVQLEILNLGDRIELFYEDSPKATIRVTVNCLTKSDLTVIAAHQRKDRSDA